LNSNNSHNQNLILSILVLSKKWEAFNTKYYYAFKDFQGKNIITIDDDKIYPSNFLKELYLESFSHSQNILFGGGRIIDWENNSSYWDWQLTWNCKGYNNKDTIPLGVMGIYYPSNFICKLDFDFIEQLIDNFFTTDDLLLKFLSLRINYPIYCVNSWSRGFISFSESKNHFHLSSFNKKQNDINWKKINFLLKNN
ncbi:hypothetical protein, partial [uncultured Algoriphagus sp.]|uniref:hypothetical protein n=1 Tax=uncultured Algoriphagus sp. TaxID=417365 RepID=UPI00259A2116